MKKIRIILLAAVLLLVGLPPVFGMLTESQVRAQAESLRERGRLLVTDEQYDRGWFSSRALLSIEPGPTNDATPRTLIGFVEPMRVVTRFKHGPVSVQDGFFMGFSELVARPAPAAADGSASAAPFDFEFRAQSTFDGSLNFAGEILPFDAGTEADGSAVSFSGGSFHGTVAGNATQVTVDADAVQYRMGTTTFSLLGIHGSVDNELVSRVVMPGVMALRVDRMSMDVAGESTVFDLRALDVRSSTALDESREHLNGTLRLELERLRWADETEVTGALLETAAERLDVAALEAYAEATARAAEMGAPLADEITPPMLRLLGGEPAISIDTLRLDVNGATLEASAQATADAAALPPAGAADIRDPALWTAVLDGYADIVIAKTLAEQAAIAIAKSQITAGVMDDESMPGQSVDALARAQAGLALAVLSAQGYLEDRDSLYRTELRLEDGRVTINGQPLPFFDLP
jgi:uncharacterized protein YdgA (DUF945 family)